MSANVTSAKKLGIIAAQNAIGKGITTSSIGRVLKDYGFSVTACKIDPYLNVDAGTMNPIVHGEVLVREGRLTRLDIEPLIEQHNRLAQSLVQACAS